MKSYPIRLQDCLIINITGSNHGQIYPSKLEQANICQRNIWINGGV